MVQSSVLNYRKGTAKHAHKRQNSHGGAAAGNGATGRTAVQSDRWTMIALTLLLVALRPMLPTWSPRSV